jgi:hypothetical protein
LIGGLQTLETTSSIYYIEEDGSRFLWDGIKFLPENTASHSSKQHIHSHRHENIKSYKKFVFFVIYVTYRTVFTDKILLLANSRDGRSEVSSVNKRLSLNYQRSVPVLSEVQHMHYPLSNIKIILKRNDSCEYIFVAMYGTNLIYFGLSMLLQLYLQTLIILES